MRPIPPESEGFPLTLFPSLKFGKTPGWISYVVRRLRGQTKFLRPQRDRLQERLNMPKVGSHVVVEAYG